MIPAEYLEGNRLIHHNYTFLQDLLVVSVSFRHQFYSKITTTIHKDKPAVQTEDYASSLRSTVFIAQRYFSGMSLTQLYQIETKTLYPGCRLVYYSIAVIYIYVQPNSQIKNLVTDITDIVIFPWL